MEDDPYTVVNIVDAGDAREPRGSRTKFWVRFVGEADRWLLKFPRPNTGEHWAEKVAFEIGHLVGVDCAQVELARYFGPPVAGREEADAADDEGFFPEGELATICKSFLPGEDAAAWADGAFHGWEVLQYEIPGYDTELVRGQREHNVRNIARVMYELTSDGQGNPGPGRERMLEQLASYALLDGLIGNTDRHHENWMVAYVPEEGDTVLRSMPSFDHASSLGRELTDERRRRYLESDGVLAYLRRGRGGVLGHGGASTASQTRTARTVSLTSWTRRGPGAVEDGHDRRGQAGLEGVLGSEAHGLPEEGLARSPTTTGQPRTENDPARRRSSWLPAKDLPKPIPGSTAIRAGGIPRAAAYSTLSWR